MTNTRGSRRISSRSARFRASRYVITTNSVLLVDMGEQLLVGRLRGSVGERDGLVDPVVDVLLDRPHVGLGEDPGLERALAEHHDRVALLFPLDLLLRPVHRARRVAHRVATKPVGVRLDQRRRLVPPRPSDGPADDLADREDIHAVDTLRRDSVRLAELPDLGLREGAVGGAAHRVAVVLAEVEHWEVPERPEVTRLVELPLGDGAVAEVADDDRVPPLVLDREGGARS